MGDYQFLTLFFFTLLALWQLLLVALLAFTFSCIVLVSLYKVIRGFVRDEMELWYLEHRVADVIEEAHERHDGAQGALA
jgi:hypothetical protein